MGKIRINELARELEVKSNVVLDYVAGLGIPDKKSHSSALDDDLAEKVRAHFQSGGGAVAAEAPAAEEPAPPPPDPAPAPVAAEPAPVLEGLDLKKLQDLSAEA